ncbi:zinc-finger homeodomain-containing protein 9 [Artemisia annua]|uniref:Zinc-finger homeodomain-containing protein 9 n=1 Tax=Artemisia annua TaxID=35608 RepID=A0A2U1L5E4_ARTAN|nr:zinc-finger homeodomain-containing protein 9 [Artemisia annua]
MGGHAVDGCGEFMPSPTSVPTDPTSLKCAACGCHRNFHRREPDEVSFLNTNPIQHVIDPAESPSPPPISSSYYPSAPHMLLALSTGAAGGTVSAPPHMENTSGGGLSFSNPNSKKRFRTKFTQDQKQKMHELAERVGWKMQKKDEDLILGFCNEIGVDRGVFKVWMHNNKMTLGNIKKDTVTSHTENHHNGSSGGIGIDFETLLSSNVLGVRVQYAEEHQCIQVEKQAVNNIPNEAIGNIHMIQSGKSGSKRSSEVMQDWQWAPLRRISWDSFNHHLIQLSS